MTVPHPLVLAALAALAATGPARGLTLPDPATLAAEEIVAHTTVAIPVGSFDGTRVPMIEAEGAVTRRAWHAPLKGRTTLQVLAPLRDQLYAEGFLPIHECGAESCGGFDFRFATDTLPEPAMHVDLGDFRFLSARRLGSAGSAYVTLMVSRSSARAFVQVTRVGPAEDPAPDAVSSKSNGAGAALAEDTPLADRLDLDGHAVLADLDFATGSAALAEGEFASLAALARYLANNPDRAVMLVGHTDAVGALDSNIALSRKRAEAVRGYLIDRLGVPASRVAAGGAGYLAPVASNRTEAGRMQNRRVEVILTTAE
ncbi:OmpA family protein [Rhodovulum euryhalinum]|uniref:OOP family OmpA-OmpF porin n=1 Tax=Rhodovulum euryhalinum TaxID=35805 RepID=A0A4R2KLM3_9RHOB|nr:OmpA family protein [Rhodovulum euryhalinum]TCO73512.1 OOP family OmpA-OmpF porin [Rhodovulum euryhalinum]